MSATDKPPPATPEKSSWSGRITTAAAVLGSLIAVGQGGAELIRGVMQERLENIKANADMFDKYFQLVLSKDTTKDDRVMLLGAIAAIPDHPLKDWAEQRYQEQKKSIADYDTAVQKQNAAASEADAKTKAVDELKAQIEEKDAEIEASAESPDQRKTLQAQLEDLTEKLALAEGDAAVGKANKIQADLAVQLAKSPDAAGAIVSTDFQFVDRLTVETLQPAFPGVPSASIAKNLPFLKAALKEFDLTSPELIAATLATMRAETGGFEPLSELPGPFNTDKAPFDKYEPDTPLGKRLGNVKPGDGALFKGRGYVQITGRANYQASSTRLGLGSHLVDAPDDANAPDVAARILCAYIADRKEAIRAALTAGDFAKVRKLVTGGLSGLAQFESAYGTIVKSLTS